VNKVNLIHIESRPSKPDKRKYEFFVHCKAEKKEQITDTIENLKESAQYLHVLNKTNDDLGDSGDFHFLNINSS
jgi:prephenate dehydratase